MLRNQLRLILTILALCSTSPAYPAEPLTVLLLDNRFEPAKIIMHAGHTYELHLENRGKDMHEFTAPAFLRAAKIEDKRLLSNVGTDIVVQPGKSATIVLTAPAKGQYPVTCADHDWDGMIGTITVD